MKKISFLFAIMVIFSVESFAQNYLEQTLKTFKNPEELVSLAPTISFNQAIEVISKVSEKLTGRNIVSTVSIDSAIGVQVQNMNYMQALTMLVKMQGLVYEEKPNEIIIKSPNIPEQEKRTKDNYVSPDTREVRISAVFFEEDVSKAKQEGINWQTAFQNAGLNIASSLISLQPDTGSASGNSTTKTQMTNYSISGSSNFGAGGYFGKATAIFQFFENHNLGEIISSPNITVLDGTKARLQDGQDISIQTKDFSGNVITNFYPVGSIVDVTPYIITQDGMKYILLNIHVERSSYTAGTTTTIINKTSADTRIVMLNGEETVIGGMFINQNTTIRTGVPFLKDLPWWFFGLRYIFGSDQQEVIKKELVILIRASLVPSLKERLNEEVSKNPLKEELKQRREEMSGYEQNHSSNNGK
jgi:type IV pilus assembly protein PilQ